MYRKRLAALIMTGCLLASAGCSSSGSGPLGFGLLPGGHCCGHGSSRSPAPMVAAAPAVGSPYASYVGSGPDCPCQGGGGGLYHPTALSHGIPSAPIANNVVMGDMGMPPSFPSQQFPVQQTPVITPGVPPMSTPPIIPGNPIPSPGFAPNRGPTIVPVPSQSPGVSPSVYAPSGTWSPGSQ